MSSNHTEEQGITTEELIKRNNDIRRELYARDKNRINERRTKKYLKTGFSLVSTPNEQEKKELDLKKCEDMFFKHEYKMDRIIPKAQDRLKQICGSVSEQDGTLFSCNPNDNHIVFHRGKAKDKTITLNRIFYDPHITNKTNLYSVAVMITKLVDGDFVYIPKLIHFGSRNGRHYNDLMEKYWLFNHHNHDKQRDWLEKNKSYLFDMTNRKWWEARVLWGFNGDLEEENKKSN